MVNLEPFGVEEVGRAVSAEFSLVFPCVPVCLLLNLAIGSTFVRIRHFLAGQLSGVMSIGVSSAAKSQLRGTGRDGIIVA